jgi:hypothetical protein
VPVKLHWGSASAIRTFLPRSAIAQPRLKAVVVLLTPPLWLKREIIGAMCLVDRSFNRIAYLAVGPIDDLIGPSYIEGGGGRRSRTDMPPSIGRAYKALSSTGYAPSSSLPLQITKTYYLP